MATNRPTTVRRTPEYMGPDKEILPAELDALEKTGKYLFEPKMDGMFCSFTVGNPDEGRPHLIKSRDARTSAVTGSGAGDLLTLPLPLSVPEGSILIGELESASQWAKEQHEQLGYRRVHLFDLIRLGSTCYRDAETGSRYHQLKYVMHDKLLGRDEPGHPDHVVASRLPVLPAVTEHFRDHYDAWIAKGWEGGVLKEKASPYRTTRLDGKTDAWLRCKRVVTDDFVLMGFAMTPGGKTSAPQVTGRWGMFPSASATELVEVIQSGCPSEYLREENFGKLVAEFKGWKRFASGALQHHQFVRIRTDKQPGECVKRS